MTRRHADYFPRNANMHVANLDYHAEVDGTTSLVTCNLGVLLAALPDGILDGASIAAANSGLTSFNALYSDNAMGKWGRNVTVLASGAATGNVVVRGLDYLGQPMSETLALNGTTAVAGKKAFKTIQSVGTPVVAGVTIDLGWGNVLGLPFNITRLFSEMVDGAAPTAGTFVAGGSAQSATSNDPRGTYTPHTSAVPNASRSIAITGYAKEGDLHGPAHFYA